MKKLLSSDKMYVMKSKISGAGRGVFARKDIKKDETVEVCPIIKVPKYDMANLNDSTLVTYFFYFGKSHEQLLIALGFGSIYNHSYKPNAKYKIKNKENLIEFIALADIKKDEEITYDYSTVVGSHSTWTMECSCGSENCRRIIGSILTIPQFQLRYYIARGVLPDFVSKELNLS